MRKFADIDDYIASCSIEFQPVLQRLRAAIHSAAPKAVETMSYGMPAVRQHSVLVCYALAKKHIGFYPTPSAIVEFDEDLAKYKTSKGAIQFPLDKPLPIALIKRIVKFRVKEDFALAADKADKKKSR